MSEHYLIFACAIDQRTQTGFIQHLVDLKLSGATKLTMAISSPGGNVVCGITMYNVLMSMSYEVVTHNVGNVDSIANVLFLAGKTRLSNSSSTFMFHGVGFEGNANERLEEKNLLEKLDLIDSENTRISSIISARSTLALPECLDLFKQQKTRDATWAATSGLVHTIADFALPGTANVKYLT